jgi:hypothetical protein
VIKNQGFSPNNHSFNQFFITFDYSKLFVIESVGKVYQHKSRKRSSAPALLSEEYYILCSHNKIDTNPQTLFRLLGAHTRGK